MTTTPTTDNGVTASTPTNGVPPVPKPFDPHRAVWSGPDTPLAVLKKGTEVIVIADGQLHIPGLPGVWAVAPGTKALVGTVVTPAALPATPGPVPTSESLLAAIPHIDQAFIEAALADEGVLKLIAGVVKADPAKGQAVVAAVMQAG